MCYRRNLTLEGLLARISKTTNYIQLRRLWTLLKRARCRTVLGSHENWTQVEPVRIWIIAVQICNLRNDPTSRAAFHVNEVVHRVGNIRANVGVRNLYAAQQDTAREPIECLFGRIRMNGGNGSRMAGIQKLQQ